MATLASLEANVARFESAIELSGVSSRLLDDTRA